MRSVTKQQRVLAGAILTFIILKVYISFSLQRPIWWDEAIYLNMAKFLATAGESGMWEILRPPMLPVFLSVFSLSQHAFVFALIFSNSVAIAVSLLIYFLLRKSVDEWIAVLASMCALFAPVVFSWSGFILTSYLAGAFILAAGYMYTKQRHVLTALFVSLAFLTRFPAGLALVGFALAYLYRILRKVNSRRQQVYNFIFFCVTVAAVIVSWLLLNWILWHTQTATWWHAALRPLLFGASTALLEGQWLYKPTLWFYAGILLTQLPVVVFAFATRKRQEFLPLAITGTLLFIFFSIISNQQERFILLFIPIVCVFAALGADSIAKKSTYLKWFVYGVFIVTIIVGMVMGVSDELERAHATPEYDHVMNYLSQHPVSGTILINDPRVALEVDNSLLPVYYERLPLFDEYLDERPSAVVFIPHTFACEQTNCSLRPVVERLTSEYILAQSYSYWDQQYYFFFTDERYGVDSEDELHKEYNLTFS